MSARRMVLVVLAALALVATPTAFAEGIDEGFAGLGADAGGFDQAIPERRWFSRGFWRASRLSHGMVVSDRQSSRRSRRRLRRSMDAVPPGWRAGRRAPGLGQPDGLDGPCGGDHRHGASVRRDLRPRRRRTGRGNRAAVSRVDRRLDLRGAPGGARREPGGAGSALARAKISANGPGFRYAFDLAADKPLVLHGDSGFSRKSDGGRASYYFSQPFFKIDGVLVLHGRKVELSGLAWMDREWSSQPLAATQKGWDWFSLHLSSGEKLMVFRLRDGTSRDFCAGTWIGADGAQQALDRNDIALAPLSETHLAGRVLPVRWKLVVKSHGIEVETAPVNAASWMATSFPYWEGPIIFHGSHEGKGYLEMTGY